METIISNERSTIRPTTSSVRRRCPEADGPAVGSLVELSVGHGFARQDKRGFVRVFFSLLLKNLMDGLVPRVIRCRVVEFNQQLSALPLRQELDVRSLFDGFAAMSARMFSKWPSIRLIVSS
jgi:hypothetical protein